MEKTPLAIVPAAGRSSRMGRPKLLLPFAGTTVLGALVAALRGGGAEILLVLAPGETDLAAWAAAQGVAVATNPDPSRGMLSTIQAGLNAAGGPEFVAATGRALLVAPGDLPTLQAATVAGLLAAAKIADAPLAVPTHAGRRGHPLLIAPALIPEIASLDPEVGLRQLLDRHTETLLEVPVDDPGCIRDLDDPEAYRRLVEDPGPPPGPDRYPAPPPRPRPGHDGHDQGANPAPTPPQAPPLPRRRRRPGRAARIVFAVLLLFILSFSGWEWATWPDVGALAKENPETTAFIERWRDQRRSAGKPDRVAWRPVPYRRISPHLKRAILVAEDIGFFDHEGFAVEELKVAVREAVDEGKAPRGASTLTQQLAKNLWLSPSRNPLRKIKEALMTASLERHLEKRRILEIYLNVVEFGPGIYGAEAAARHYFDTSAAGLDEAQAAQLAASLPRPSTWHPGSTSRGYRAHVERIRRRMDKAQFLWNQI